MLPFSCSQYEPGTNSIALVLKFEVTTFSIIFLQSTAQHIARLTDDSFKDSSLVAYSCKVSSGFLHFTCCLESIIGVLLALSREFDSHLFASLILGFGLRTIVGFVTTLSQEY